MMKKRHRILSVFLSLCMVVSCMTAVNLTASAETAGTCGDNVNWTLNGDTLTISGTGPMKDFTNNLSVDWNNDKESIKSVVIENGVTSIGKFSFSGCTALTSVTIPGSVTSIGANAFYGCTSLASVTIPESVTTIGSMSFYHCTGLASVTIPESVTSIGASSFEGCIGLTSVIIPGGVTTIETGSFKECTNLTSVTIPDGVTTIGNNAFRSCTNLTSVTIPDNVTTIGDSAFYGCTGLASVTIPESVTSLGLSSFRSCTGLRSVIFVPRTEAQLSENANIEIKKNAFSDNEAGITIAYGEGVTKLYDGENEITDTTVLTDIQEKTLTWKVPTPAAGGSELQSAEAGGGWTDYFPEDGDYVLVCSADPSKVLVYDWGFKFDSFTGADSQKWHIQREEGKAFYRIILGDEAIDVPCWEDDMNYGDSLSTVSSSGSFTENDTNVFRFSKRTDATGKDTFVIRAVSEAENKLDYVFQGDISGSNITIQQYSEDNAAQQWLVIPVDEMVEHTHDLTYAASGNTITATCANREGYCFLPGKQAVLKITAPANLAQGGSSSDADKQAQLTGIDGKVFTDGNTSAVTYYEATLTGTSYAKSGSALSVAPTAIGDYVAEVTVTVDGQAYTASVGYSLLDLTIIGTGTDSNDNLPTYSFYNYSWSQQIYTKGEVGKAGTILAVDFCNVGEQRTRNLEVYMMETDKDSFGSGEDWVSISSGSKVFSGNVTFATNVWTSITFDTPFTYSNTKNLLLCVRDMTGSYESAMSCQVSGASGKAIYVYRDDDAYDIANPGTSGTVLNVRNNIRLAIVEAPVTHTHDSMDFTAWDSIDSLPTTEGSYYLTKDVTIDSTWNVPTGITNLCLNGHIISRSGQGDAITLDGDDTLNLYDCGTTDRYYKINASTHRGEIVDSADESDGSFIGGYITAADGRGISTSATENLNAYVNMYGGTVFSCKSICGAGIYSFGHFHMYDGAFIGNYDSGQDNTWGGAVYNAGELVIEGGLIRHNYGFRGGGVFQEMWKNSTGTIKGGRIIDNIATDNGGGIYLNYNGPTNPKFIISGNPEISGNKVGDSENNVYILDKTSQYVSVGGELSNTTPIGISMQTPGVFTNSSDTSYNNMSSFASDNSGYIVGKNAENQLFLGASVTATFDANGHGTAPEAQNVASGSTVTEPEALVEDEYIFGGWYREAECTTAWNFDTDTVTGDTTLYAKWTEVSAIKYDLMIAGEEVTSQNTSGDGWSYDNETNTLTLSNYSFNSTGTTRSADPTAIMYYPQEGEFHIVLEGENSIVQGRQSGKSATWGIYSRTDFTISGSGTLDISTVDGEVCGAAIYAEKNITIDGGTVNAASGSVTGDKQGYGIGGGDSSILTIGENAKVTLTGPKGGTNITVKNSTPGIGWTDTAGTQGQELVEVSESGQNLISYQKVQFPAQVVNVTFKVTNGSWDDGTKEDQTVTLFGRESDALKLTTDQIPAVGSKPNDTYMAGSWDVMPDTDTAITAAATYTYTYDLKAPAVVTKAPTARDLTYNGSAQELVNAGEVTGGTMQYVLGTDAETAPTAESYTTEIPTAADAGTYYIWYRAVGDESHLDSAAECVPVEIAKASITITADDKSSKYKADIQELTWQIGGDYVEGDELGILASTTADNTARVGEYPITLSWNENPNYEAALVSGKYSIVKTDLELTVSGYSGTYDGKAHGITVDMAESDAVVYYSTETELTAENYKMDGSITAPTRTDAGKTTVYYYVESANYEPNPITGFKDIEITPAVLTVTADEKEKVYGEDDPELTYQAAGFVNGETKEAILSGKLSREEGEIAGTYEISQGTLAANDNYAIDFTGAEFQIIKAEVTVTVPQAQDLTYNGQAQELVNAGEVTGGTMQYALGTDAETAPTAESYTTEIPTAADAGTYYIWYRAVGDESHLDSAAECVPVEIAKASITITADDKSSKYKADIQELTWSISEDYVEGDELGILAYTKADNTANVGEYPITLSWNENPNYDATLVNGTYYVTKTELALTVSGYSGTYDGKGHGITVDLAESDAVVYYSTETELTAENYKTDGSITAPARTDAGKTTVYYYVESANYEPNPITGFKEIEITQAILTVTAEAKEKTYGEDDPEFTYQAEGFVNDETKASVLSGELTREEGEKVGTYEILQGTLTANDNYTVNYTGANLIVKKRTWILLTPPTARVLVYNGSEQELIDEVDITGGIMYYAVTVKDGAAPEESDYSADIPKATEAGAYVVYYYFKGDDTYSDAGSAAQPLGSIAAEISAIPVVTGYLYDADGVGISGAVVKLMQGNEEIASVTTSETGEYRIAVKEGTYNIVASWNRSSDESDVLTKTALLSIDGLMEKDILMPTENVSSVLKIGADTKAVVVDGLDAVAEAVMAGESGAAEVTVTMSVEEQTESSAANAENIQEIAPNNKLEFFEIKVEKIVDSTATTMETTGSVIEIVIPYDYTDKAGVTAYRYHDSVASALAESDSREDGTFRVDRTNGLIYIYANQFSLYAIGYTPYYSVSGNIDLASYTGNVQAVLTKRDGSIVAEFEAASVDKLEFRNIPKGEYILTIKWIDGVENSLTMPITLQ